jgi:hypothetical protein
MRIASKMITDAETGREHFETLIQTELGTYFILDEDISTGEVRTRRVTAKEALEFREFANGSDAPTGADF